MLGAVYLVEKLNLKHFYNCLLYTSDAADEAKYAKDFVYTENLSLSDKKTEIPIGVSCRTCDRLDCSQRAFPPLHKKFDVDVNARGVSVYVSD